MSGVAYSGGTGNRIARVEVSTDGGASWTSADMLPEVVPDDSSSSFGWVRWMVRIPLIEGRAEVVCRATDAEGVTQPEVSPKQRGYLYNGWCRVNIAAS